jgi:hypothetical protein
MPDADAAPDAPDSDGSTSGTVTMNVTLAGAPEPGVLIVFDDSQGAILSSGTTDATGTFAAMVPSGSQVTVVLAHASVQIETVTGLTPGDVLNVVDLVPRALTFDVALPPNPPTGTTLENVLVSTLCGSSAVPGSTGAPFDFTVSSNCLTSDQASLFVFASGSSGEVGYAFQKNVPIDGPGVDAGAIPVSFAGPWSPSTTMTLTTPITTLPLGSLAYEEASAGTVVESSFPPGVGSQDEDVDAGIFFTTSTMHPDFADAVQVEGSVYEAPASETAFLSYQGRATRIVPPTSAGTVSVDLTNLLPAITAATSSTVGAGGTGAPTGVTWTTAAPLSEADAIVVALSGVTSSSTSVSWTIFAPASATSVHLPALPASAAALTPSALSSPFPTVYALGVSLYAGYADFKTAFQSYLPGPGLFTEPALGLVPILPALGSARITAFSKS